MMGSDLAERLRRAGVEASGQRRNVTVLFADISGYTALSGRIDGEDLYNLVQEYVRTLSNNVYKYEGVVDKLTGDGLMALFGAPISHENNAERAVRAALDMQNDLHEMSRKVWKELGVDLNVRIGLHSGSVIVGGIGSDLLMNYTAIGDTVNLAHRIEEAAPPGAILISEAVFKQVRAFFDCQQISVLNPKGIAHPVVAYRVVGLRTQAGSVRGIEGLRAPMIGRDQELIQLKQAAQDMVENRRGQFALITGDAGLGKSRLTAEFKASLDQANVRILEGQSLAYRRVSYWLIREVLLNYLGLPSTTHPLQVRERLKRYTYQLMGSQASEALPYLEHLMSLPYSDPQAGERVRRMEAGQLRQQVFLAVRDLLLLESYNLPLVLVLDDLHWADEVSLDLLYFLLEVLRQSPIFILAISRSIEAGALERAVIWARQNLVERFRHIPLQNLSLDQSKQLLYLLLSIPDLPESLREQIVQRAAGVPFYLEEILRMLIDQGVIRNDNGRWQVVPGADVSSLGVPDTLQELILARFDRLQPAQRKLLQVASVIGKDFSLPVLSAVIQDAESLGLHAALDVVVEREFILPQPGASDTEYTFRHILMSDAIYGTMLRKDRSVLHGQVADSIEQLYADRLEEQVEVLANHYRWSPRLDRALHYLILAGQKAARNHVNLQARQHFDVALELLPVVTHTAYQAYQVHSGMGDARLFSGDYAEARADYEHALETLSQEEAGTCVEEHSSLQRKIARTFERQGDYDQAVAHLSMAQNVLDGLPTAFPVERAQVWNDLAWIYFRRGNFPEADKLLNKALSLVKSSDAYDVIASIYNRLGGVAYNQGNWEGAATFLRRSIAIRESIRDLANLATSFNNLGLLEIEMGHFDSALENLTRSYELKTRLGQAEGVAMALNNLGWLRIQRGELDEARQVLQQALDLSQQIGYTSLYWQVLANMGEMYLAAEDWEQARRVLDETARAWQELGVTDQLADNYRQLGEAALGSGNIEAALGWVKKAGDLLEEIGNAANSHSAVWRARYLRLRGRLSIRLGDWHAAQTYLEESRAIFHKLRSRLDQARILYCLGELAQAQGEQAVAQERYTQAVAIFRAIGARLDVQRAEQAIQKQ